MLQQVELSRPDGAPMQVKEILDKSQVVVKLIAFLSTQLHVVTFCFEQSPLMEMARITGFENFINFEFGEFTMAEMLSNYADSVLRKNGLKVDQA